MSLLPLSLTSTESRGRMSRRGWWWLELVGAISVCKVFRGWEIRRGRYCSWWIWKISNRATQSSPSLSLFLSSPRILFIFFFFSFSSNYYSFFFFFFTPLQTAILSSTHSIEKSPRRLYTACLFQVSHSLTLSLVSLFFFFRFIRCSANCFFSLSLFYFSTTLTSIGLLCACIEYIYIQNRGKLALAV